MIDIWLCYLPGLRKMKDFFFFFFFKSLLRSDLTEGRVFITSWRCLLHCLDGKAMSEGKFAFLSRPAYGV